jgi:hypothetical protein
MSWAGKFSLPLYQNWIELFYRINNQKLMKTIVMATGLILALIPISARAQVQTIVAGPTSTNSAVITVSSNSFAVIKSVNADFGGTLLVTMHGVNFAFDPTIENLSNVTFSGPATIQLQGNVYGPAFATVEVEPGPFPPGKTLAVGANSGNVQVTMQVSTDLVNWTPAVNGTVYTNSPDARFFRIQVITNP